MSKYQFQSKFVEVEKKMVKVEYKFVEVELKFVEVELKFVEVEIEIRRSRPQAAQSYPVLLITLYLYINSILKIIRKSCVINLLRYIFI